MGQEKNDEGLKKKKKERAQVKIVGVIRICEQNMQKKKKWDWTDRQVIYDLVGNEKGQGKARPCM